MKVIFLSALVFSSVSAFANFEVPVVDYQKAEDTQIWAKVPVDQIPSSIVTRATLPNPENAFAAPYANVFLQNRWISVCWISCAFPQIRPQQQGADYKYESQAALSLEVLATSNVYHWVTQLFIRMEQLGFKTNRHLTVIVNRTMPVVTSGSSMLNNAFFNDQGWTLSFLNSRNSFFSTMMGMTFTPSFLDPSVALHEATHSVFQTLIGKIINNEVFGLHEAFADYFAMSILNAPTVMQVMMHGKPGRSALGQTLLYKPGMEAHDLGNVVMAALWKIRVASANKDIADRVALETVRVMGANPYTSAGDVVTAYSIAYQKIAGGSVSGVISGIWASTGLKPTEVRPNAEIVTQPAIRQHYVVAKITQSYPAPIAQEWGYEALSEMTLVSLGTSPGPTDTPTIWYNLALTSNRMTVPVWFLYNTQTKGVVVAYMGQGASAKVIDPRERVGLFVLQKIIQNLQQMTEIDRGFSKGAGVFFDVSKVGMLNLVYRNTPVQYTTGATILFNGHSTQILNVSTTLERTFGGDLLTRLSHLIAPDIEETLLSGITGVTMHVVPKDAFADPRLPILENRFTVIGYTLVFFSGMRKTMMITEMK